MYRNWINGLLGLVVLGAAFVDLSPTTLMWVLGIAGAVIAISSFWELVVGEDTQKSHAGKIRSSS